MSKVTKGRIKNIESQNIESYKRQNNKTSKMTIRRKRSKITKSRKSPKITKSRKRKKNPVQYGKNQRKNFFPENKKGGKKFPWAFSFSKQ